MPFVDLTPGVTGASLHPDIEAMRTLHIDDVPEDLYAELQSLAAKDSCSVDQEALRILASSVELAPAGSILDLKGLGKDLWAGIDPAEYVDRERGEWK